MKIDTVLGVRPQFIKASVVSHAIVSTPGLTEGVVHTGQHYDANMCGDGDAARQIVNRLARDMSA
jgi:UDP-N-acetylglucosamine 2-epimerase